MDILTIGALGVVVLLMVALVRNTSVSRSTVGFGGGNVNKKKQVKKTIAARNPYRATSIEPGEEACSAVEAIAGKRFLDVDRVTPELPMPRCDSAKCTCKYQHHEDRRSADGDRRHPNSLQTGLYERSGAEEKRKKRRGRRKSDWA